MMGMTESLRDWYLRMKEDDVLVNRLSKAMGSRQSIVARDEAPAWICTEVRIHDLNDEWVEENIIKEIFRIFQRRCLEYVR
jgi:hypothetical protein